MFISPVCPRSNIVIYFKLAIYCNVTKDIWTCESTAATFVDLLLSGSGRTTCVVPLFKEGVASKYKGPKMALIGELCWQSVDMLTRWLC